MNRGSVLLVHMPIANPIVPNLAIERLAAVLRKSQYRADTLYGTLRYFPELPSWMRNDSVAPIFFAPHYHGGVESDWIEKTRVHVASVLGVDNVSPAYMQVIVEGMAGATACIAACMAEIRSNNYDVIGFSMGFDAQRLPSAALAAAIKAEFPHITILAGGSACDGQMGRTLLELFPCFDTVISGEAEGTIVAAVVQAMAGRSKDDVLSDDRYVLTDDLDGLDCPDYTSFFAQARASEFSDEVDKFGIVLYEGSRGCWYGKKNHCTFCGIRAVDHTYRTVSPARFLDDVVQLQDRYAAKMIYLTDAILSREAFTELLPDLAALRSEKRLSATLFAETKSNLSITEIAALKKANVLSIQPGIESFLTSTLHKMRKGATGIQQVELLKWCRAFGIKPIYSLLLGVPGETAQDQYDLADICGGMHHLPPPIDCNPLALHRFSPYFDEPARFGIVNIRPFDYQRLLYQCSDDLLLRLCYEFAHDVGDYDDMPTDDSFVAVRQAVSHWSDEYKSAQLRYWEDGDTSVVIKENASGMKIHSYRTEDAKILGITHTARSIGSVVRELGANEGDTLSRIHRMADEGVLALSDNRVLNLAIPSEPEAYLPRLGTRYMTMITTNV